MPCNWLLENVLLWVECICNPTIWSPPLIILVPLIFLSSTDLATWLVLHYWSFTDCWIESIKKKVRLWCHLTLWRLNQGLGLGFPCSSGDLSICHSSTHGHVSKWHLWDGLHVSYMHPACWRTLSLVVNGQTTKFLFFQSSSRCWCFYWRIS